MAEIKPIKLRFADAVTSPVLEIGNGDYARKFETKDQPFECATEEECDMLLRTGHFVEDDGTLKPDAETRGGGDAEKKPVNLGKIGGSPAPAEGSKQ